MSEETKNIIQLKESTSGPTFYPETHKAAIVGKEDYPYLGEVVSPGGGGGGSTGTKGLSVSPRQSYVVGRIIPLHPRKGKKYYFADGLVKVKNVVQDEIVIEAFSYQNQELHYIGSTSADGFSIADLYVANKNIRSNDPVVVTITREWQIDNVDLSECSIEYCPNLNSITESPHLEIINGSIRNVSKPNLWLYRTPYSMYSMPIYNIECPLQRDKLRAIHYETLWSNRDNGYKRIRCYILQPNWLKKKLERYGENSWQNDGGNGIPCLHHNMNGSPFVRTTYAHVSGRVYLYTVCRKRVGTTPEIIHFFRGGRNARMHKVFYREKMCDALSR